MSPILDASRREQVVAAILAEARTWIGVPYLWGGNDRKGIDCSHFVYQAINAAVLQAWPGVPFRLNLVDYQSTATMEASGLFAPVTTPERGDLVMWDGHVGIVTDPASGRFIGAQSSTGVADTDSQGRPLNYQSGYWGKRAGKHFVRLVVLP